MSQLRSYFTPRFVCGRLVPLLLTALAACDRSPRVSVTDSLLARDLTLAAAAAPSQLPLSLSDTAINPTPRAEMVEPTRAPRARPVPPTPTRTRATRAPVPQPATAPEAATPNPITVTPVPIESAVAASASTGAGRGAIGSGSALVGTTSAMLCSLANRPGDRIVAILSNDVISPDGATLRAGTPILVEMATPTAGSDFAFRVKAVQVDGVLIPIEGTVRVDGATTERRVSKGGDQGKVIGGAIAGAILGRVLGGGTKGTVIGAAGGAAAGTIAAARNTVTEKCLPFGSTLTVTLSAPLVLTLGTP